MKAAALEVAVSHAAEGPDGDLIPWQLAQNHDTGCRVSSAGRRRDRMRVIVRRFIVRPHAPIRRIIGHNLSGVVSRIFGRVWRS